MADWATNQKQIQTCRQCEEEHILHLRVPPDKKRVAFYPKDEVRLAALQADKAWDKLDIHPYRHWCEAT